MIASRIGFRTSELNALDASTIEPCDILFTGDTVDDRGAAALRAYSQSAKEVVSLRYVPSEHCLYADNQPTKLSVLQTRLDATTKIRIETTTLGVTEILRIVQCAMEKAISEIEFIYVEPGEYRHAYGAGLSGGLIAKREFALTDNRQFVGVQGFSHEYDARCLAHHAFFLGFESARLAQALEQRGSPNAKMYRRYAVIGVPAFTPGWENNVLANHAELLRSLEFTSTAIDYCAANSIRDAYMYLWQLLQSIGDENSTLFVSPLGTKPHAVATALFLAETKGTSANTSLYYDHPAKKHNGSTNVGKWHRCKVTIEGSK